MIFRTVEDGQLFVWWNGALIYKRWLARGYGLVMDAWGLPWKPED